MKKSVQQVSIKKNTDSTGVLRRSACRKAPLAMFHRLATGRTAQRNLPKKSKSGWTTFARSFRSIPQGVPTTATAGSCRSLRSDGTPRSGTSRPENISDRLSLLTNQNRYSRIRTSNRCCVLTVLSRSTGPRFRAHIQPSLLKSLAPRSTPFRGRELRMVLGGFPKNSTRSPSVSTSRP